MYTINNTRGTILTTINDGVVDSTTTVSLPGRQYQNYGELVNENFIKLLENSAGTTAPGNPLEGELWYDTTNSQLKVNRGGDSSLAFLALATTENGESNITIVGDDSTGTAINLGQDFQIAGGTGISTSVSGDVLTITADEDQIVNSLESSDSTEIIVKDSMSVQGTVTATTIDTNEIKSSDSTQIQITDRVSIHEILSVGTVQVNEINSTDSAQVTVADGLTVTGAVVMLANLPTSDPANAGQLYNDSGTLKVSSG